MLPAGSHRCRVPATPRVARRAAPPDDADAAEVVVLRRPGAHVPPGPLERELDLGPESRLEVNDPTRRVQTRPGDSGPGLEPFVEDSTHHL